MVPKSTFQRMLSWCCAGGLLAVSIFLGGGSARAQGDAGLYTADGEVSLGARTLSGSRKSNKFDEYRDLPKGFFLEELTLDVDKKGTGRFYEFRGRDVLEEDQSFRLSLGRIGTYRLDMTWNQTPHVFSRIARTPYRKDDDGAILKIPDSIQSRLQTSTDQAADLQDFLRGADDTDLEFRRDRGEARLLHNLLPGLSIDLSYASEGWMGNKARGTLIGPSPGPTGHITEIPEPVDYRTHDVKAKMEYEIGGAVFQLDLTSSFFNNANTSLTWDNPLRSFDTTTESSRGQLALAPDNSAHNVSLSGAYNLPMRSRIAGTLSYGWMLQNDDFLPATINSALITDSRLTLPRRSLDGQVNTTLANFVFTSRAIPQTSVTARYRYYEVDNKSESITFPAHVVGDISLSTEVRRNLPYGLTKQDAGVDASVRLTPWLSVKPGYSWTGWDRSYYEVDKSQENTLRVAADLQPLSQVMVRSSYARSWLDPDHYDTEAPLSGFPEETEFAGQLAGLRKYDQAARTRDEARGMIQYSPADWVTLGIEGTFTFDDFRDPEFGLDNNRIWGLSFNVTLQPTSALTVWGSYSFESNEGKLKSRQTLPTSDLSVNNWQSFWRDTVNTLGAGAETLLYEWRKGERLLTGFASFDFSFGQGRTSTQKQDNAATLVTSDENYPDIKSYLTLLRTGLKYQLFKNFGIQGEYRYERLDIEDFTQKPVEVYPGAGKVTGTALDFFLGAETKDYEAHIVGVSFRYSFSAASLFASASK